MKKKNDLQSPDDIGKGLGLNAVEIMLMKYKAEMSKIAVQNSL